VQELEPQVQELLDTRPKLAALEAARESLHASLKQLEQEQSSKLMLYNRPVFRLNAAAEAKDAHQSALAEEHAKAQTLQQQITALQAQADKVPRLELAISTLESAKAGLSGDVERLKGLEAGICALAPRQSAKTERPAEIAQQKDALDAAQAQINSLEERTKAQEAELAQIAGLKQSTSELREGTLCQLHPKLHLAYRPLLSSPDRRERP
jgi:chromosome segregation ATPase